MKPAFSYSGTSIKDLNNNSLSNISSTMTTDGIKPKPLSRITQDQDGNGYIDTIKFSFSEELTGI